MSGIAAIFNRDGRPVEPQRLTAMLDAVAYRGPDGAGTWAEGSIALGQRMLYATPEAVGERQPWSDETGRYRLVFDGRIDNGPELRARLAAAELPARSDTDAELVLRSYQCWGEKFANELLGDFAILIWDARSETLIAARDPSGSKPLHYYADARQFICGSELHQLFHCEVPCEPNEAVVGEYLALRTSSADQTLYRSIRQLMPAHLMVVRRDRLVTRSYYDLDPALEIRHRNDDEYAEHFLSLFKEAVRCRMRAVGPVAADLSGGLDSSSIVCIAQMLHERGEARCGGFESFSRVFPGLSCDESEYIRAVAAKSGAVLNLELPTYANQIDLAAQVRQYRNFPDYPNLTSGFGYYRAQARKGVRVTISGVGGDERFTGSLDDNADRLRTLQIRALLRQLRIDSQQSETRLMRRFSPLRLLLSTAVMPLLPGRVRQLIRRVRGIVPYPQWLNPDFVRRTGLHARLTAQPRLRHVRGIVRRDMYQTFHSGEFVVTHVMVEQALARMGLELRQPFLDRRIIEFGFGLPGEQLRRDGFERHIVRHAMRGILPELVRTRISKATFNQPVLESVSYNASLLNFDRLEIAERGWVDAAKLKAGCEALMASYRDGEGDYAFPVWIALATEIWHRVIFGRGQLDGPRS